LNNKMKINLHVDLIFILGKIGSGKDTAADYLNKKYNFTILRYGDIIKNMMITAGWDGKKDIRGRKLMLDIGEAFRKWDENVFVKQMINLTTDNITIRFDDLENINTKRIVISDVRLPNEIFYYKKLLKERVVSFKDTSVKMLGSNYNNSREIDEEISKDPTETSLDDYEADYFILNDQYTKLNTIYENLDVVIKTEFGY